MSEPASERLSTHALLDLQHAETSLVRAALAVPDPPAEIAAVRYLLGFCRLTTFQPGAAVDGKRTERPDVTVADEVEPFRERIVKALARPLRAEADEQGRIRLAVDVWERFGDELRGLRTSLLDNHRDDFSPTELDAECGRKRLVLVDGGVASNVPAEQAWRRVQAGRMGTRNAFVLAWDCFHPQWDPRHLWLQPITQAMALQHVRNGSFADWMVRFKPTLSPIDLVPTPARFDKTLGWGEAAIEPVLPMLKALLEPVDDALETYQIRAR